MGAQGVLHADVRVLSALQLTVDGVAPEHIATRLVPATGRATAWSSATYCASWRSTCPVSPIRSFGWTASAGSSRAG